MVSNSATKWKMWEEKGHKLLHLFHHDIYRNIIKFNNNKDHLSWSSFEKPRYMIFPNRSSNNWWREVFCFGGDCLITMSCQSCEEVCLHFSWTFFMCQVGRKQFNVSWIHHSFLFKKQFNIFFKSPRRHLIALFQMIHYCTLVGNCYQQPPFYICKCCSRKFSLLNEPLDDKWHK